MKSKLFYYFAVYFAILLPSFCFGQDQTLAIKCTAYKPNCSDCDEFHFDVSGNRKNGFMVCQAMGGGGIGGLPDPCKGDSPPPSEKLGVALALEENTCHLVMSDQRTSGRGFTLSVPIGAEASEHEFVSTMARTRTNDFLADWLKQQRCGVSATFLKNIDLKQCSWKAERESETSGSRSAKPQIEH